MNNNDNDNDNDDNNDNNNNIFDCKMNKTIVPKFDYTGYQFVYVIFFTPQGKKGYACFAFNMDGNKLCVGHSFCSPKDKFDKERAKRDAVKQILNRILNKKDIIVVIPYFLKEQLSLLATTYVKSWLKTKELNVKGSSAITLSPMWTMWMQNAVVSMTLKYNWMSPKQFVAMNTIRKFYLAGLPTFGYDNYDDFKDFNSFCEVMDIIPKNIKKYMGVTEEEK